MKDNPLYFDSAAAGMPNPMLAKWYGELQEGYFYNPHGGTCYGEKCRRMALEAERRLLFLLGIKTGDAKVIWTSGVTEALNLAVLGYSPHAKNAAVLLDPGAHSSLSLPCLMRQKTGASIHSLPLAKDGMVDMSSGTVCDLLALSLVNNETGAEQDLRKCRNALDRMNGSRIMLVDAAQAFCKQHIPWSEGKIDMLALSSRKIGGPAAVGALVIRKNRVALEPNMLGGGQQDGLRPGTVDVCGVEMFVRTAESVYASLRENGRRVQQLSALFWRTISEANVPEWLRISPENASPHIAMLSFPGYEGAVLARILADKEGILISSSAACSAENGKPSATIAAMGFDESVSRGAIRVSFSPENTEAEVLSLVAALKKTLETY